MVSNQWFSKRSTCDSSKIPKGWFFQRHFLWFWINVGPVWVCPSWHKSRLDLARSPSPVFQTGDISSAFVTFDYHSRRRRGKTVFFFWCQFRLVFPLCCLNGEYETAALFTAVKMDFMVTVTSWKYSGTPSPFQTRRRICRRLCFSRAQKFWIWKPRFYFCETQLVPSEPVFVLFFMNCSLTCTDRSSLGFNFPAPP